MNDSIDINDIDMTRYGHLREEAYAHFKPFIDKMHDDSLVEFTKHAFSLLPDYWFLKPASSTGKYHPRFANGVGGLVRHTLYAVNVFDYLYRAFAEDPEIKSLLQPYDCGIVAVIFHDAIKYGVHNGMYTTKDHDRVSANWLRDVWTEWTKENPCNQMYLDLIYHGMIHHMGPWSTDGAPTTLFEKLVFIADYVASQKTHEKEIFQ